MNNQIKLHIPYYYTPIVDGVVHNRLVHFARRHTEIRRLSSSSTSLTALVHTLLHYRPDWIVDWIEVGWVAWAGTSGAIKSRLRRSSSIVSRSLCARALPAALDPRAVAVSRYGWLKTSYGWLAASRCLRLKSAENRLSVNNKTTTELK